MRKTPIAALFGAKKSKPGENRYAVVPASQGSCGGVGGCVDGKRERERERERESEEGQTVQSVLIEKQQRKKRKEFAASVGKFGRGSRSTI